MNDQRAYTLRLQNTTYKQQRACDTKTPFPSKRIAAARARLIGGTMNAYRCPLCRRWHLGHRGYGREEPRGILEVKL
jgi:hypothetical protein